MSSIQNGCVIINFSNNRSDILDQFATSLTNHKIAVNLINQETFIDEFLENETTSLLLILWQQQINFSEIQEALLVSRSKTQNIFHTICVFESSRLNTSEHLDLARQGSSAIFPLDDDKLNTDELIASVITAINTTKNWQQVLDNHRTESHRLIMNVMRQNSEMGLMSQFSQNCNSTQGAEKIATLVVSVLNEIGLESVCEIRMLNRIFTAAKEGRSPTQTELQILKAGRNQDRLVTSQRLAVVNYPNITLLIKNMPIYDEDRYGHCKDLVVQLGDVAQSRIKSLGAETAANERAEIIALVQQKSSDNIHHMNLIMKKLLIDAETSLSILGCTEAQEQVILDLIENARAQLDALHDSNALLEDHLAGVMINFPNRDASYSSYEIQ